MAFRYSPSSTVVLFPPCGILHSHIDDTGTLNATLEEGPILPVISGNIPAEDLDMGPILLVITAAGDLEMATKVCADTRLPSKHPHQLTVAPLSRREALRSPRTHLHYHLPTKSFI